MKDLWKILECVGHPVTLESLEGLVIAVGEWYCSVTPPLRKNRY